jgi:hypothetical protein
MRRSTHLSQILDLFAEASWRNVYAGELELRPPGAPTTELDGSAFGPRYAILASASRPSACSCVSIDLRLDIRLTLMPI